MRLRRRKSPGSVGLKRLEWTDIQAFIQVTGTRFSQWEITLIEDVDDIFCNIIGNPEPTEAEKSLADFGETLPDKPRKTKKSVGRRR